MVLFADIHKFVSFKEPFQLIAWENEKLILENVHKSMSL